MPRDSDFSGVHPRAIVAPWVTLGRGVQVHPYAIVGRLPDESPALARRPRRVKELHIGAGTVIGPHAVVYADVIMGKNCLVGDFASVREGSRLGDRVVVGRYVSINYDCEIADDVRFQDTTHLTGGAKVGKGCFFGVGVITSNDRRVDLQNYHYPGAQPTIFGERVLIGSGANVLAGVTVGDDAVIAAGALVVKDVPAGVTVMGPIAGARPLVSQQWQADQLWESDPTEDEKWVMARLASPTNPRQSANRILAKGARLLSSAPLSLRVEG